MALNIAILDLRPRSATFGQSFGAELSAENRRMMYVPRGFAHGFLTLAEDTEARRIESAACAGTTRALASAGRRRRK